MNLQNSRKNLISVVIATKNEEDNIAKCISTVNWADEIIVVDMNSTDKTREIAKSLGAKVIKSSGGKYGFIPHNKNLGYLKAKSKWILNVDADERVSFKLARQIRNVIASDSELSGYKVPLLSYFWGKWLSKGLDIYQIRFFKRNKGVLYGGKEAHDKLKIKGKIGKLSEPIYHAGHLDISSFIDKMNFYTSQDAFSRFDLGIKPKSGFTLTKDVVLNFYYQFIKLEGYKEGAHGLSLVILMSMYMIVENLKLWEIYFKKTSDNLHKFDGKY